MLRKLFNISHSEKSEAVQWIIEDSTLKIEQIVLNIIAVIIAVLWIYQDSIPLITASMIIAPLILPIIGTALWITLRNRKLIIASLRNLWTNTLCIFAAGSIITLVLRSIWNFPTWWYIDWRSFYYVTSITWIVAGVAAAFMLSKKSLNDTLAWIAIAVALVPPLALSTIHLSLFQRNDFINSFWTYLITIITIIIGSTAVFYLMNFKVHEDEIDEKVEEEEKKSE